MLSRQVKLLTAVMFAAIMITGAARTGHAQDSKPATQGDEPDYSQSTFREVRRLQAGIPPCEYLSEECLIMTLDLWHKAADQGSLLAQYSLALAYREGRKGLKKDDKEAMEWLQKAADQGDANAQYDMAVAYHKGLWSVKKDDQEAFKWLQKGADQGDADAQSGLGTAYYHEWGVKKDLKEAAKWWLKAGDRGNSQALYFSWTYAGVRFSQAHWDLMNKSNDEFLFSRERNLAQLDMYRKAAGQGNALAQYALGDYSGDYAMLIGNKQDYKRAVKWYRKAADQGYAPAQFALGDAYHKGSGVKKDEKEAVNWWLKAAAQDNLTAQYALANAYHEGVGIGKDDKEAVILWRKVAEHGYHDPNAFPGQISGAAMLLGDAYHNGEGVRKDLKEAVKWWSKAENDFLGLRARYDLFRASRGDTDFGETNKEMVDALRKNAKRGNAMDQLSLGLDYYEGAFVRQDSKKAVKWWSKSADQGNPLAQYYLGYVYETGNGAKRDNKQAVYWWLKAADQGYAPTKDDLGQAETALGASYACHDSFDKELAAFRGNSCEKGDDKEAARWYRKAADLGYAPAQKALDPLLKKQ